MSAVHDKLLEEQCVIYGHFTVDGGYKSRYLFDFGPLQSSLSLRQQLEIHLCNTINKRYHTSLITFEGGLEDIVKRIAVQGNFGFHIIDESREYKDKIDSYPYTTNYVLIDTEFFNGKRFKQMHKYFTFPEYIKQHIVLYDHQQNAESYQFNEFTSILNRTMVVRYRLKTIKKRKQSSLCFSADCDNIDESLRIINEIGDKIVVCKIHTDTLPYYLQEYFKQELLNASIEHDFLIMEDRKFNDISWIVQKQYQRFYDWVDLVTVHSLVASDVFKYVSGAMIVSSMSNQTYDFTNEAIQHASEYGSRVAGFITQKRIQVPNSNENFVCMTPGVRPKAEKIEDQNYRPINDVDTDFYVVGRAIYQSKNPREAAFAFLGQPFSNH
jgi:orotidine 5'-phosphate decarboxylase subfamily 1